ncbi:LAT2 domain-containing protein [Cheilinus undulatus]|uniref:LAT2 domain-containing protein n=1 Tax=Cheilinus undulatus TaxID=241271 RepID=UPI001BD6A97B|nr:LAT2 domain-containing protein [Cheilinus undulatus]
MWWAVERGSTALSAAFVKKLKKNEDRRTTEGMIGNSSVLSAVLTVVSVLSLSLLALFCVRCKKKPKTIHEEHQIYNPQTFQRAGSRFAVTRSKTVTRANQMTKTPDDTGEQFEEFTAESTDGPSDYMNIIDAFTGTAEHTYVAPLPVAVYANDERNEQTGSNLDPGDYENIQKDDDDYENSEFLKKQEDEEPDYVNENGDCS